MSEHREIDQLNWLGKAVFFAGQGVKLTAELIDSVIDFAAETYTEAEKAFKQGLDPMIDDATVIEERSFDSKDRTHDRPDHDESEGGATT